VLQVSYDLKTKAKMGLPKMALLAIMTSPLWFKPVVNYLHDLGLSLPHIEYAAYIKTDFSGNHMDKVSGSLGADFENIQIAKNAQTYTAQIPGFSAHVDHVIVTGDGEMITKYANGDVVNDITGTLTFPEGDVNILPSGDMIINTPQETYTLSGENLDYILEGVDVSGTFNGSASSVIDLSIPIYATGVFGLFATLGYFIRSFTPGTKSWKERKDRKREWKRINDLLDKIEKNEIYTPTEAVETLRKSYEIPLYLDAVKIDEMFSEIDKGTDSFDAESISEIYKNYVKDNKTKNYIKTKTEELEKILKAGHPDVELIEDALVKTYLIEQKLDTVEDVYKAADTQLSELEKMKTEYETSLEQISQKERQLKEQEKKLEEEKENFDKQRNLTQEQIAEEIRRIAEKEKYLEQEFASLTDAKLRIQNKEKEWKEYEKKVNSEIKNIQQRLNGKEKPEQHSSDPVLTKDYNNNPTSIE